MTSWFLILSPFFVRGCYSGGLAAERPHDGKAAGNGKCREGSTKKMQATPRRKPSSSCPCGFHGSRPSTVAKSGVLPAVGSGPTSRCPLLRFPAMIPNGLTASCGEKPMQTRLVRDSQKRPRGNANSGFLGVLNLESYLWKHDFSSVSNPTAGVRGKTDSEGAPSLRR